MSSLYSKQQEAGVQSNKVQLLVVILSFQNIQDRIYTKLLLMQ
jgi:hypothetical protein